MLKKLLISLLAGIILIMSVAPVVPARAADTWYSSGFPAWYTKVYGGDPNQIFGERYTAAQVQWVFYGFFSMVFNWILTTTTSCSPAAAANLLGGNTAGAITGCLSNAQGYNGNIKNNENASMKTKDFITFVFADRQLSGITYVKNTLRKFSLIPQAHAQTAGFGFTALNPIEELWAAARNLSYGLFVIAIIVLAFMIMFRIKLSPQVVVTAQSALPRIAIALVLVTFSYAIAGFLIDLMYVVIGLLSIIFSSTGLINGGFLTVLTGSANVVGIFNVFVNGPANLGVIGFLIAYMGQFFSTFLEVTFAGILPLFASTSNLAVLGGFAGAGLLVLAVILAVIALIVLIVIFIFMFFKIIWTLVKAFAMVMFLTVILPLQITLGVVVPGIGFSSWLKQFIANLTVFPIVGTLFLIAFVFMTYARRIVEQNFISSVTNPGANFSAGWPPLLGSSPALVALCFLFASFFIISLVPKSAEVASGLISGKFQFGNAIGEALKPVSAPIGGIYGGATKELSRIGGTSAINYVTGYLRRGRDQEGNAGGLTSPGKTKI